MSKEVADDFIDALRKLEEDKDVEALVKIHAEDCEVGNVSVSKTFRATTACASSGPSTARPSAR